MDDFFRFSKKSGFGVFLVHPTVVSVLLSASVEKCFVSRMRDFLSYDVYIVKDSYNRLSELSWKLRYGNHKANFKTDTQQNGTATC